MASYKLIALIRTTKVMITYHVAVALASGCDCGTLVLASLNVAHDAVVLQLADLGTLEGILVEWIADLVCLGTLLEGLDELVILEWMSVAKFWSGGVD